MRQPLAIQDDFSEFVRGVDMILRQIAKRVVLDDHEYEALCVVRGAIKDAISISPEPPEMKT